MPAPDLDDVVGSEPVVVVVVAPAGIMLPRMVAVVTTPVLQLWSTLEHVEMVYVVT
jgi:hypothetical protein